MTLNTHLMIDTDLCGTVTQLGEGSATVELVALPEMGADENGLVHGGFIFGAADYAAMAAVNAPTVVLAAAGCRFLAPSKVGDTIVFKAECTESNGNKYMITVSAYCGGAEVFTGEFKAVVTAKHVLE